MLGFPGMTHHVAIVTKSCALESLPEQHLSQCAEIAPRIAILHVGYTAWTDAQRDGRADFHLFGNKH